MVLLDAAKGCGTAPPDLTRFPADFVAISFYKVSILTNKKSSRNELYVIYELRCIGLIISFNCVTMCVLHVRFLGT